jgi:hypothetical protein
MVNMKSLNKSWLWTMTGVLIWLGSGFVMVMAAADATAGISAEEAAELGRSLTPMGAERAGNSEGTIPAWTGGITTPPADYSPGDHHPDPFANDKVLFTITGENVEQYQDNLSSGQVALLKRYPSYKLPVYPSRRSASYPSFVYEATTTNATRSKLTADGNGIEDAVVGVPFPIPENGHEVIWNHILRYRGVAVHLQIDKAVVTRRGDYTLIELEDWILIPYSKPDAVFEGLNNLIFYFKEKFHSPPSLAGQMTLMHETMNQVAAPRRAWAYEPGQRRVRRMPYIAYDCPYPESNGLITADQVDMFNGALDRYQWTLLGKKEIYIPYNAYNLHSDQWKYSDIIRPLHINQELTRYELHRVWVIEATKKQDSRHIYARRIFYVDEDSWQIQLVDIYNKHGDLWRVSEGHAINYYEVPSLWTTLEVHYDLLDKSYAVQGLDNENEMYNFDVKLQKADFAPSALIRDATR